MLLNCIGLQIYCSQLSFINWLQYHLLPCPFKFITGIDCPGCGFQRSAIALIQGNFQKSFLLYPPAIPLLLFFSYAIGDKFLTLDNQGSTIKKSLFMVVGSIVMLSYITKMYMLYAHYKTVA